CATLSISGLPAAPVAVNDRFSIDEDGTLTVTAFSEIIADSFGGGSVSLSGDWTYLDSIENELGANHSYPVDSESRNWNHPDFNPDTSTLPGWKSAPSPLQSGGIQAFPNGTPDTLLGINAAPDGQRNLSTTYLFRNSFEITQAQAAAAATFTLVHVLDDGAAIYINGTEVARPNLPGGDLTTNTLALASIPDETSYAVTPVDLTGIIQPGVNTIAVELHQGDLASSDVGFDLLVGTASNFTYTDDPFGTAHPDFASGQTESDAGFDGAAISTTAGGRPPFNDPTSGGWQQTFNLAADTTVSLSLAYRLVQNENLEPSEYSEAVASIGDTRLGNGEENSLARFYGDGDGNGGGDKDTGWQLATFEVPLPAGQHTLTLGVFNNGTSQAQELATAYFDDVTLESRQAIGGVLANDTGSPDSAALRSGTINGSLAFSPDGTFSYTPIPDFNGSDVFTYVASNATGDSSPATVVITILPQNDPPAAVADTYPSTEDIPLTIAAATGLLANDIDIDSAAITATDVTYAGTGSLDVSADGSFTYTPAPEFSGPDTFTYLATDGSLRSTPTTVTIDVAFVDDTPIAFPDTFATSPATPLVVNSPALSLVANDTDAENQPLIAVSPSGPTSGSLQLNPDGTFAYTPAPGFSGTASFTYRASDTNTSSQPVTVTVNINSRPVSQPDNYTVEEDRTLDVPTLFGVLHNDSDVEGDPVTTAVISPPANGVLLLDPDGTFSYQPDPDFSGTDSFTYITRDAFQSSLPAVTTLNVTPVNDPPTARPDTYRFLQDTVLTVPATAGLLANDSDPDSPSLTAILVSPPVTGTLDLDPDGSFTYTPAPAFTGPVTFSYATTDGALGSSPTEVEFDVNSPAENIVINEIMYHPESESDADEFIELHNTGDVPVDLSAWSFTSGISLTFPPITIPPGGYLVAAADPEIFAITYPDTTAPVAGPWTGRLSNSGERIRLRDSNGDEIDDLTYADQGSWADRRNETDGGEEGWTWVANHDGGGSSLELINPAFSNRRPGNWAASSGPPTPGTENSRTSDDIAPIISNVSHHPLVPLPTDPVTVTAELDDDTPAPLAAILHYRLSIAGPEPEPFTTVPMSGDLDNRFTAQIPPLPTGTVVEFYVSASDGTNSRSYPAPSDAENNHDANLLYQVDDEFWTGDQPIYRLVILPSDQAVFVEDGSGNTWNNGSNAQVNATFITTQGTDTTVRYQCGVRRRGAGSRGIRPHNWRINIPRDTPLNGVSRLNLNTQFTFLQFVGNKLAQAAGLASADLRPVSVRMNGTDHSGDGNSNRRYGLYVHAEVADSQFAASHFPHDPQGNIYRARRPDSQWAYHNGNLGRYAADGWAKQTNASQDDWSDLDNLLRVMNQASGPTYVDQLSEVADIDA
ncbi:MAG: Ig-like domain-containing protein, partial [Verrucomicrobiales bacterium]|nr:Ig-like domain-containing protein [Verrucomicrobiales bacterium]